VIADCLRIIHSCALFADYYVDRSLSL